MGKDVRSDPAVVVQDGRFCEPVGGIEVLLQIRHRKPSAVHVYECPIHAFAFTFLMLSSSAATRSAGPSPSSSAVTGASTGGRSFAFFIRRSMMPLRRLSAYFPGSNSCMIFLIFFFA